MTDHASIDGSPPVSGGPVKPNQGTVRFRSAGGDQAAASDLAHDISSERDPLDWYIEVCGVCGCQLGPGVGTRTRTGRCIYESHRSVGGIVVRVAAKPLSEQERKFPVLARLGVPDA